MKKFLLGLLFLGCASSLLAATIPEACEAALRRALDSDAAFRVERRLPGSAGALVSTGVVSCAAGRGIVWDVRHPFVSSVTMTTNAMIFVDEDERRVKPLKELRHYDDIRRQTDAFVAGDKKAFKGIFDVDATMTDAGEWSVTFTPDTRAMRRLLKSITVSGKTTLDAAIVTAADGGVMTISFTELGHQTHRLWTDAEQKGGAQKGSPE